MLSHDSRLRCELVDLYYTLYGTRRPTCLPIPELAGVLNLQKHDIKKMKSFSSLQKSSTIPSTSEGRKNSPSVKEPSSSNLLGENNMDNLERNVLKEIKVNTLKFRGNLDWFVLFQEEIIETHVDAPKQEYFSDNSVSLPGLMGQGDPVGFEPGMFKKDDTKHKLLDPTLKLKKKKKDKKKHKHKHKHKHDHKHSKDKEKKEKDPNKMSSDEDTASLAFSMPPSPANDNNSVYDI